MEPFAQLVRVTTKDAEYRRNTTNAGSISMTYSTTWDVETSFSTDLNDSAEAQQPDTRAPMPNIYAGSPTSEPQLVKQSLTSIDRSDGFDPYDTGVLQYNKFQD